jgi:hypothetical protein
VDRLNMIRNGLICPDFFCRIGRVFLLLTCTGCATPELPQPQTDDSSLLILSFRVSAATKCAPGVPYPANGFDAYLSRHPRHNPPTPIYQTREESGYYIFANTPPCSYEIEKIEKHVSESTHSFVVTGFVHYLTVPGWDMTFRFADDVVEKTRVDVRRGSVMYVGDFTARVERECVDGQPSSWRLLDTGGASTGAGREAAMRFLRENYSTSPWLQRQAR